MDKTMFFWCRQAYRIIQSQSCFYSTTYEPRPCNRDSRVGAEKCAKTESAFTRQTRARLVHAQGNTLKPRDVGREVLCFVAQPP